MEDPDDNYEEVEDLSPPSSSVAKPTVSSQNKIHPVSQFQHPPAALAKLKRESRLMAKNPTKFLEDMRKAGDEYSQSRGGSWKDRSSDTLNSLLAFVDLAGGDGTDGEGHSQHSRLEDLKSKQKLSKTRALLLSMTSSSSQLLKAFSRKPKSCKGNGGGRKSETKLLDSPSPSFSSIKSPRTSSGDNTRRSSFSLDSWSLDNRSGSEMGYYFNKQIDKNSLEEMEKALENFIDEIRNSDIDNIVVWLSTLSTLQDYTLPFGVPSNLSMPQNPLCSNDPEISSFIETGLNTFLLVDAEYHKKLEEVSFKLKINFDQLQSSKWSARDSALLYHILTSMADVGETPKSQQLLFQGQMFKRLFPGKTEDDIVRHKYRIKMKRAWEEKRDNIIKDWIRDKEDMKVKMNLAWKDIQEKNERRVRMDLERKKQKEVCQHWKELLESMRKEKRRKVMRIQVMVESYEKLTEERERIRMEGEERKRLEQKKLVDEFKDRRKNQVELYKKEQERIEKELEKNQKMQAKYNKTRVLVRQFEYEKKQEAQKELEKLKAEEKQLKEELLEKSKYRVDLENYDPSNVLKDTYASRLRRHEVQQFLGNPEEDSMIKFFRERYSFSSETVCKDRRIRLETKLRDAGLLDTTYARQILQAMQPPQNPLFQSNIKFDDDP